MQPIAPLDAAAALVAAIVIAQSLTLGAIQSLRIADRHREQAAARSDARRHGAPAPHAETPPGAWLLLLLLLAALQAAGDLIQHLGFALAVRWLSPLHDAALLLFGPAMWFYARAITLAPGDAPPAWRHFARHALPAALLAAVLALDVLQDPWTVPPPTGRRSGAEVLTLLPIAAQILAYLVAVVWRVRSQRARLEDWFSRLQHRQLRWLEAAAWTFALLLAAWVGSWSLPVALSNVVSNGLMAVDVALLGLFGARQSNVFGAQPWLDGAVARPAPAAPSEALPVPATPEARDAKYAKAALPPAVAEAIAGRLAHTMQVDKPYLQNELTLAELAAAVQATPHQLSQVLSTRLGQSFFEYVNGLRVDAVKATLARPSSAGRPLLEIALECGFGSKSTFNEAFKRATGMSPSEYRRSLPAAAAAVSAASGMQLR